MAIKNHVTGFPGISYATAIRFTLSTWVWSAFLDGLDIRWSGQQFPWLEKGLTKRGE